MTLRNTLFALFLLPAAANAGGYDNVIQSELLPGWRLEDGRHMAALRLTMAPGWKTYWRSPGDAGIPPLFTWRGNQTRGIEVMWPAPEVFYQSGMRSIGYVDQVILPLRINLKNTGKDTRLRGVVDIGICKDVCLPHRLRVDGVLPVSGGKPDPVIAAALASAPYTRAEAGVTSVRCKVGLNEGAVSLRAEVTMPWQGGSVDTVIETADPQVWVSEPDSRWDGNTLIAEARMTHMGGQSFAVDRSKLRITVLAGSMAVDIHGCDG